MDFHPPLPTIARIHQLFSQVLGTRPNTGLERKLDRYAVEIQFDVQVLDKLRDEILKLPFTYPNDGKKHIFEDYLNQIREVLFDNPAVFPSNVPADIYPCRELLTRSLIERVAGGLFPLVEDIFINEPNLCKEILLSETPLQYGFSLVLKEHPDFINQFNGAIRDKIQRWLVGKQKPSMKDLFAALRETAYISNIRVCEILCIAMILEKSEKLAAPYYKLQDFFKKMLDNPKPDYYNTTKEYIDKVYYIHRAFLSSQILIQREAEKQNPDFDSIIYKFKGLCRKLDIDSIASKWRLDLLISLQKIFEGDYKGAQQIYEYTIPYVFYTVDMTHICIYYQDDNGKQAPSFYHIALAIGAINQDRPFLKMMKNYGILFNLFGKPIKPIESSTDRIPPVNKYSRTMETIVEDWEVKQWANNFFKIFPSKFLKNIESIEQYHTNVDLPIFIEQGKEPKEPIKPYKKNFQLDTKIFPQLAWFTYTGNINAVKTLLESNVNVNSLTSSSESALLFAIEAMVPLNRPYKPEIGKELFDLISQYPHDKKTINTPTDQQKITCLGQAVWTGNPEIVEKIIKMGAEIDALMSTDRKTALYRVVQYCNGLSQKLGEKLKYTPETIDGIRRGNEFFRGMTNDQVIRVWFATQQNPLIQASEERYQKHINELYKKVCTKEKMLKIADVLLRWGADPNLPHDINGIKGYTPLMFAAEKNNLELFKLMIENPKKPGNPNQRAQFSLGDNLYPTASCWEIAKDWGSNDILQYLDENKNRFR